METTRRALMQAVGAGAVSLTLAAISPAASPATAPAVSAARKGGRKMIIRADDVGHSKVCNIGTFEAIDNGVVTAVDAMLDSPGTEDALERLKAYPWISVGWHMHMWGAPVLGASQVPSLVEKGGPFDGRFRLDLARAPDVVPDEAVRELRAQVERCIRILGKAPDTGGGDRGNSPWGRACLQVQDEFGLPYNYASSAPTSEQYTRKVLAAQKAGEPWAKYYDPAGRGERPVDPKWASRKIYSPGGQISFLDLYTDSISAVEAKYDPVLFYTEDRAGILKLPDDMIVTQAWHPGYVDYYVYRLGERINRPRAQQFVVGRTQDVAALCDPRLKNWIRQHRIELVNLRDALYGSREYQNHLRLVGSDLAIT